MYLRKTFAAAALAAAATASALTLVATRETEASGSCMPAELRSRLSQVSQKFGGVEIISTYRAGARTPSGRPSYHASCQAVDFRPPAGRYSEVANWLKANHGGGVGTYGCGMNHIHIDTGPMVRFHSCQGAEAPELDGPNARTADTRDRPAWPRTLPSTTVSSTGKSL